MAVYFTSDTHYFHQNVILYSQRPFSSREEMNEALIYNWNKLVRADDEVYHLGDFSFSNDAKLKDVLSKLNGRKKLVFGNHDNSLRKHKDTWVKDYFERTFDMYKLKVQDPDAVQTNGVQTLVMCHFPFASWEGMHRGVWSIHGHCHATLKEEPHLKRLDIGVDMMAKLQERKRGIPGHLPEDYRPFTYQEVKEYMATKVFAPVDHHREEDAY